MKSKAIKSELQKAWDVIDRQSTKPLVLRITPPAEPDSKLREKIAKLIAREHHRKLADSILALTASQKDKEIAELKEKLKESNDMFDELFAQNDKLQAKRKAEVERIFKTIEKALQDNHGEIDVATWQALKASVEAKT